MSYPLSSPSFFCCFLRLIHSLLYTVVGINPLCRGTELASVRSLHSKSLLPREAAPITERLRAGMDFGEFTDATFAAYYK